MIFRQCGRAAAVIVVALLGLAAMTTGREAPAIESGRQVAALGARLGPAPHEVTGFKNLDPNFRRASNWTRTRIAVLGMFSLIGSPRHFAPLSAEDVDTSLLWRNHRNATATWVGHSTVLIQLDGINILTDPNWSPRTGPLQGRIGVRRYTPPGVPFDQLPSIDVALISHDHYDHLDEPTVRRLAARFNTRFLVPLGIKAWMADRGITNVQELDWGESVEIGGVTFVCTPAQHGSGRTMFDQSKRLWASWAVIGTQRFYFGGDTGYASHFKDIGKALGPFDLAALPIGSYTPPMIARPVHMSPEEALQAWFDLRARRFIGIHWGTFSLGQEPYDEPPRRLAEAAESRRLSPDVVRVLKPGETMTW